MLRESLDQQGLPGRARGKGPGGAGSEVADDAQALSLLRTEEGIARFHLFPEAGAVAAATTAASVTIWTAGGLRPGPWGARGGTGPGQGVPRDHSSCTDRLGGQSGA